MSSIRVGMIGTGGIAHWHGRQLLELTEVEIRAIADPSEANRARFVETFGLGETAQFADYEEMLAQAELDAVVLCSPHTMHYEQASAALQRGLHVLIEKPMTCSSEEAEKLIVQAEQAGRVLQVSYQRHFQPEFLYIRDAIARGEIGKLTSVTASLYQEWGQGTEGSWRQNPALSGGGFLMDSGSHIIDVLLWTTGLKPLEIQASLSKRHTPVEIDSFTTIRFEGDVLAGLNLVGWSPCWHETYIFCGETGGIFYDNGKITLRRLREEPIVPELPQQTTNQDKSFIDAIAGRIPVQVTGEFALQVVRFSESVYKAAGYSPIPATGEVKP
ncbi:Gfo/Idh/MocA family protein [Cohnella sp. REN36]|uniref:Gfo/Idh/MocA family protein n=1 Tax=Cohnella sp. REN36 TaxID=2887347 RepID=UPI001D154BF8|nr:Gfo/Idh/MocA family oxidoreductase [Cohnella sp. REN36]MCC3377403.1 Gfo/Idh/MocA family oxidoreductase [Cohnella sp. REN36]